MTHFLLLGLGQLESRSGPCLQHSDHTGHPDLLLNQNVVALLGCFHETLESVFEAQEHSIVQHDIPECSLGRRTGKDHIGDH